MMSAKDKKNNASARKPKRVAYEDLRALALSLALPGVSEAISWGQPTLKAHGKLWFFWNPKYDAPVFKVSSFDERDMLIEAAPDMFFTTDHHRPHNLVLVYPERVDLDWVQENLTRVWRAQAPKRVLKAWDAEHGR